MIDAHTGHSVTMEPERHPDRVLLPVPAAMLKYGEWTPEEELEVELFSSDDFYVIQRPLERVWPGVAAKLRMSGCKIVVEVDDYLHTVALKDYQKILKKNDHRLSVEAFELCLRMADIVTVSTEALKEAYSKFNPNVHVLRNKLLRRDIENIVPSFKLDRGKIRVGWMGIMNFRANDLSVLKPWLQRFLKNHPEVVFVNVGSKAALEYLSLPKDRVEHFDGATFPKHLPVTSQLDIGLVPLTRNYFNECKSYLKGMEYGAVGAMVIASPTHEYREWVQEDWNGNLASSPADWYEALEHAVLDDHWREMAERNWEAAYANLIDDHYHEWMDALGLA